jgi:hypothetical protein
LNSCHFTCRPANTAEPSVVYIGNGTRNLFALTNIDIYTMVECTHSNNTLASRHLIYNETHVAGTYFVHLTSCLCSIVFANRPTVFPLWPCRQEDVAQTSPVIRLVIPIRWSTVNDSTKIKAMTKESELFPDKGYDNLTAVYRPAIDYSLSIGEMWMQFWRYPSPLSSTNSRPSSLRQPLTPSLITRMEPPSGARY